MKLFEELMNYQPWNETERQTKDQMLRFLQTEDQLYTRANIHRHITASPWIINQENTKVLMVYHSIYQSWSWCGGHADGDQNLKKVAIKEGKEETGIKTLFPYHQDIFAIDILPVLQHDKNHKTIQEHQHLNFTYLCIANEQETLQHCPKENSDVKWIRKEHLLEYVSEEQMKPIYAKLINKTNQMYKQKI